MVFVFLRAAAKRLMLAENEHWTMKKMSCPAHIICIPEIRINILYVTSIIFWKFKLQHPSFLLILAILAFNKVFVQHTSHWELYLLRTSRMRYTWNYETNISPSNFVATHSKFSFLFERLLMSSCVQVLEGKDINPSLDLMNSFHAMDTYVQITVTSELGSMTCNTRSERGGRDPKWNQTLGFSDVPLGSTITLNLLDKKKLTADVLLGQASLLKDAPAFTCVAKLYLICKSFTWLQSG